MNSDQFPTFEVTPPSPQHPPEQPEFDFDMEPAADAATSDSIDPNPGISAGNPQGDEQGVDEQGVDEQGVDEQGVDESAERSELQVESGTVNGAIAHQVDSRGDSAIVSSDPGSLLQDTSQETSRSDILDHEIAFLEQRKQDLSQEVTTLEAQRNQLQTQVAEIQTLLKQMLQEGLQELRTRKQELKLSIEQLERRHARIQEEMRQSFAGASQELAIRVQSFKDFLVGSLQDLVIAAEDLSLVPADAESATDETVAPESKAVTPRFAEQSFHEEVREIQRLLDQYRTSPDYYGPPWQLRRTFEPIHAERVAEWFFQQGGRGAVRSMNSRLQNVLIASAVISILNDFYGEQLCTLVLANSPERLGEWRRGLQDCLGISRSDFGPNQGIALFEDPDPIIQRADRILAAGNLPLILIDETEELISVDLLQFPLWLAFAIDPQEQMMY